MFRPTTHGWFMDIRSRLGLIGIRTPVYGSEADHFSPSESDLESVSLAGSGGDGVTGVLTGAATELRMAATATTRAATRSTTATITTAVAVTTAWLTMSAAGAHTTAVAPTMAPREPGRSTATRMPREVTVKRAGKAACIPAHSAATTTGAKPEVIPRAAAAVLADRTAVVAFTVVEVDTAAVTANSR